MDRDHRHTNHRIGDLIRVRGLGSFARYSLLNKDLIDELGVVTMTPDETGGILFIEAFLFKKRKLFSFGPQDLEIISNIDE